MMTHRINDESSLRYLLLIQLKNIRIEKLNIVAEFIIYYRYSKHFGFLEIMNNMN